jgi:hypothetical protein
MVLNPADSLDDGQEVRVKEITAKAPAGPAGTPGPSNATPNAAPAAKKP